MARANNPLIERMKETPATQTSFRLSETKNVGETKERRVSKQFRKISIEDVVEAIEGIPTYVPGITKLDWSDLQLGSGKSTNWIRMFDAIPLMNIRTLDVSYSDFSRHVVDFNSFNLEDFESKKIKMIDFFSHIRVPELIWKGGDFISFYATELPYIKSLTIDHHAYFWHNLQIQDVLPTSLHSLTIEKVSSIISTDLIIKTISRLEKNCPHLKALHLMMPTLTEQERLALFKSLPRSLEIFSIKMVGTFSSEEKQTLEPESRPTLIPPESKLVLTDSQIEEYAGVLPDLHTFNTGDPTSSVRFAALKARRAQTITSTLESSSPLSTAVIDMVTSYTLGNPWSFWKKKEVELKPSETPEPLSTIGPINH